jgi:NAD(P)-dependent dehydrogenase (short-subunit alcohol dehydrogenase family)
MECPGRDSLLSAIDVAVTPHAPSSHLSWRVATTDRRFRRVRLEVGGSCLHGTVDAFVTQPPSPLPTFDSVTALIGRDEFAGQRALIVGGSRGLGAATAVIVASGGGVPLVTFATGSEEAALLRGNARRAARHIETLRFDVVADPMDRLQRASRKFGPTHLYYFASPRIFVRRRGLFDAALFERFSAFYVSGFAGACAAARGRSPLTAFYPSSTALDEPVRELTEYLAAKAAGEALCRSMAETMPDVRIVVRRMGRVVTDQTASLVATRAVEPVAAMLPIVREIHRMSGEKT